MKTAAFNHPDGNAATIASLTDALDRHHALILQHHVNIYDSTDMKIRIDIPALVRSASLLKDLLEVDPRGGISAKAT